MTYDAEDHPTAFGSQMTAGYTGSGMRAWKQGGSGSSRTYFFYNGVAPVCGLDSNGTVTTIDSYSSFGGSDGYYADERRNKSLASQMEGQACSRLSLR